MADVTAGKPPGPCVSSALAHAQATPTLEAPVAAARSWRRASPRSAALALRPAPGLGTGGASLPCCLLGLAFAWWMAATLELRADLVIAPGATWRYAVGTNAPAGGASAWRLPAYDDTAWARGATPIGYGEPDIVTSVPSSGSASYLSVYLRYRFQVNQPAAVRQLAFSARVDDGYVAWINGQELGRANVPAGDPDPTTAALVAGEPTEYTAVVTDQVATWLVPGANVLAVQLLNANLGSSDLLFDGSLDLLVDEAPPVLVATRPPLGSTVGELVQIETIFDENVTGVDAADLRINGAPATRLTVVSPRHYVFEFPPPPLGLVQVAWAPGHGIADLAPQPNPFAGGSWTYTLTDGPVFTNVVISEFMADNDRGIRDEDGDRSDWIELRNREEVALDLAGWFLTDTTNRLTKWRFPSVTLPAHGYLLVWASEKDRTDSPARLHTNFKLERDGEYLALLDPRTNVVSAFAPAYPPQRADTSYGRDQGDPTLVGFFATPTPGAANATSGPGFAPDPVFSPPSGVYVSASLSLNLATPTGTIRYTTDGSLPTETSTAYTGPIVLSAGRTVKARVFVPGLWPSRVVAGHYHLLDTTTRDFTSNLPLVIVDTHGRAIAQDVPPGGQRTPASIVVVDTFRGRSAVQGRADFRGMCQIEIRGQTSAGFPKQPYNLELNDAFGNDLDAPLLGLPADADWVLNNPYSDKCFINNLLAFELHERMGHYAVRRRLVEVFVDTSGGRLTYPQDYRGIYLLQEKIKLNGQRVDLARLTQAHTTEPEITGGYIFKKDKSSPGDRTFSTAGGGGFGGQELRFHEPKPREITTAQQTWLRNYLNAFERALYAANWLTATGTNHYTHYLDPDSFVDNHWIVEFTKQIDGYRLSSYFVKDRGDRLKMEPIWDWNLSFGNADYLDGFNPAGWYYPLIDATAHIWLRRLIAGTTSGYSASGDPEFNQKIADRWSVLRTNVFAASNVVARVHELAALLNEAQARDFAKYPRLGSYVWPNPPIYSSPRTYQGIIDNMNAWIQGRYAWIDTQFIRAPEFNHPGGPVPPGLVLTLSAPAGAIYYTLDGSDPRRSGGGVSPASRLYTGPLTLTANARVVARARNGTAWSGPAAATFAPVLPPLRLTEIMYHPAAPAPGSTFAASDFEFLEFANLGAAPLELQGFQLQGTVQFTFPGRTLAPGQRVVLVPRRAAFRERYGADDAVAGEYAGRLGNGGGRLRLIGPLGESIQDFRYDDTWVRLTDGPGFALVAVDEQAVAPRGNEAADWRAGSVQGGTPGQPEPPAPAFPAIVINEALTHTDLPALDALELANLGDRPADVGGWFLTDDFQVPAKFRIPEGTVVPPGGFRVFTESDFNSPTRALQPFNLSSLGEEVFLFSATSDGRLTGYVHGFDFGAALNGVSFGRHVTRSGEERFVAQTRPTLGEPNAGPLVGPVVLSEIHYHPPDVFAHAAYWNNTEDEFIELHNVSGAALPLYHPAHPTNTWRLDENVTFTFPPGLTLPADGFLLAVNFDPQADTAQSAAFRARYNVPPAVPLVGPYRGNLDNAGGKLALRRPDAPQTTGPDAGTVPYVVVDRVHYRDTPPWPAAADGLGHSLQRRDVRAFGNDAAHWSAAAPTPGRGRAEGEPPTIVTEPTDQLVPRASNGVLRGTATGPGPILYQWRRDGVLLPAATNETLIVPNFQPAQAGTYQLFALNAFGATPSRPVTLRLQEPIAISQQPATQRTTAGASALFTVVAATPNPPLSYQWYRHGVPLPGATQPFLALTNVQDADQGVYFARLTDALGTRDSALAELRVLGPPELIAPVPPADVAVVAGETVTLSAQTRGTTPMRYRWSRVVTGGATEVVADQVIDGNVAFLRLAAATPAHAGIYTLAFTNEVQTTLGRAFTNTVLRVLADTDGDRLPDEWETRYRLDPSNPADADTDLDGDGVSNRDEYLAGTDPSDPQSYLRVSRFSVNPAVTLEFPAVSNRTYSVEFKDDLGLPTWSVLADVPAPGTHRTVVITDPRPGTHRIYRLLTPRRP